MVKDPHRLAVKNKIPCSLRSYLWRTDSGAIHLTRRVPAGVISIPCRYLHTPSEMVDLNDVEAAVRLVLAVMETKLD